MILVAWARVTQALGLHTRGRLGTGGVAEGLALANDLSWEDPEVPFTIPLKFYDWEGYL